MSDLRVDTDALRQAACVLRTVADAAGDVRTRARILREEAAAAGGPVVVAAMEDFFGSWTYGMGIIGAEASDLAASLWLVAAHIDAADKALAVGAPPPMMEVEREAVFHPGPSMLNVMAPGSRAAPGGDRHEPWWAALISASRVDQLVPGDPSSAVDVAVFMRRLAQCAHQASVEVGEADFREWTGKAGDVFRTEVAELPDRLTAGGDAFASAAVATMAYADQLRDAQALAARAMQAWEEWRSSAAVSGVPSDPWAVVPGTTGAEAHERAGHLLSAARDYASTAAKDLADVLHRAAESAPRQPRKRGLWSALAHGAAGLAVDAARGLRDAVADTANAVASVGNAMLEHPGDVAALAAGAALMTVGTGGEVVGVALDASVIGAPVGVPINAVSASAILAGGTMMLAAAGDIAQHAAGDDNVSPVSGSSRAESSSHVHDFPDKASARTAFDGDVRTAANRFFRDATGKSKDFRATELESGGYRLEFFSPANNPGYGKLYVQEVDATGVRIREFKDTMGPDGLIERKWVSGGP